MPDSTYKIHTLLVKNIHMIICYDYWMNHVKTARILAKSLDSQFSFLGIRFGWDTIIGLVPGIGDAITAALASYIVWIGWKHKLPTPVLLQMIFNIVVDTLLSSVPIIGDIFDILLKANLKNLALLEKHIADVDDDEVIELTPEA